MRELFGEGVKIMKEAKYMYEIAKQSSWFRRINAKYIALKMRLYALALVLNLHLLLTVEGLGTLPDAVRRERRGDVRGDAP